MKNKYIGGNFSSDDNLDYITSSSISELEYYFPKKIHNLNRCYFETGADALSAILMEINSDNAELYFPENYCKESISRVLLKTGITFYKTYTSIKDIELVQNKCNVLILLHFNAYDEVINSQIKNLRTQKQLFIIEDYVHAPLEIAKFTGDYAFNSLRKIVSLNVAICYKKEKTAITKFNSEYSILKMEAELLKSDFLKNRNSDTEKKYLDLFTKAEKSLMHHNIYLANENQIKKMQTINFKIIKNKRLINAKHLSSHLKKNNQFEILKSDYLFIIIKCNRRDELKKYLAINSVFAPIHWADSNSEISKKILSLPIDQRYNRSDMEHLADLINKFYN